MRTAMPASPWLALLLTSATLLTAGCDRNDQGDRPPVYKTSGRVVVAGKAAVGVDLNFHPLDPATAALVPTATTTADGGFALTTFTTGDGAPAGDYVVTMVWPKSNNPESDAAQGDRLNGRFADPKKSTVKARIVAGDNNLPVFRLK